MAESSRYEPVILEVPFDPDFSLYKRRIRFDDIDDAQTDATDVFEQAKMLLKPKVLLKEMFISGHSRVNGLPSVRIEDVTFSGKALAVLDDIHRVVAYVATCGAEMEDFDLSSYDFLAPFWLDIVKSQAYGAAKRRLFSYCRENFGFTKPLSLNPGSGNVDIWPIEQQQGLFKLLEYTEKINVRLTDSSLMVPNKSISGLMFASKTTDYESCAYCEREHCPTRRVPFSHTL